MPWIIHCDPDVNCAFVRLYGTFEVAQMINAAADTFNHPNFRVGMNILRDAREQQIPADVSFKSLASTARQMMDDHDVKLGKCRSAIVAGNSQSYAKFHQYIVAGRLGAAPIERKAFRDIEKAKVWLGLPEGYDIKHPDAGEAR